MAKCYICDKKTRAGRNRSHSNKSTLRQQKANIKKVRAIIDGSPKKIHVCTRCLRSGKVERA